MLPDLDTLYLESLLLSQGAFVVFSVLLFMGLSTQASQMTVYTVSVAFFAMCGAVVLVIIVTILGAFK